MHHPQEGLALEIHLSGRRAKPLAESEHAGGAKDHGGSVRQVERALFTGTGPHVIAGER